MSTIIRTCPHCGETYSFNVPTDDYIRGMEAYKNGALLQDAFPTFSPSVRETIKTGFCNDCSDILIKKYLI